MNALAKSIGMYCAEHSLAGPTLRFLAWSTVSVQVPAATPLSIELIQHVPMKTGEPLKGRLLYPVYVENRVAIPAGTILRGTVVQLDSDRNRRIHARLRGDFTPFHTPVVSFDELVLPGGPSSRSQAIAPKMESRFLRLSPPPGQKKGSFISREIAQEKQRVKDAAAQFTAPGRGDRLVQFLYTQLPYHPERIENGTAWTVELAQPLNLIASAGSRRSSRSPASKPCGTHDTRNGDYAHICNRRSAPPTKSREKPSRRWSRNQFSMLTTLWLFPRVLAHRRDHADQTRSFLWAPGKAPFPLS